MRAHRTRAKTVTLVEIVFAVGLLSIFVAAIFATYGVSHTGKTMAMEHQAASNEAFRQLNAIVSTAALDDIQRSAGGADVEAYAFHVPYNGSTLRPAAAAFEPLNPGAANDRAGHVRVIELDLDGDGNPDDYDADGNADILEVRVVVAWRRGSGSQTGDAANSRVEVSMRRTR